MNRRGITRRTFLASAAVVSSAAAAGVWAWSRLDQSSGSIAGSHLIPTDEPLALSSGKLLDTDFPDPFAGGQIVGYLPFELEGQGSPLVPGQVNGAGHDARRIIDPASLLMARTRITPAADFYIRTEYPDLLHPPEEWKIRLGGEVGKPQALPLAKLDAAVEPKGPVLLECSGNHRSLRFGLLSVADWDGVSIGKVLDMAEPAKKATSVLINGFDDDSHLPDGGPPYSTHSMPTCSWVFTRDQLEQTGAFLATRMNGKPLPKDQGAPVRLVVPGWYGCTEVKWVNQIKLVDKNEPATLQMLEFSDRTGQQTHRDESISTYHQVGPKLAREYVPASIDQAALAVRVEQWKLGDKVAYRVIGITWGGPNRTDKLKIRFRFKGRDASFERVQFCKASTSISSYGIWVHRWDPKRPGPYLIDVRLNAPGMRSRRMELHLPFFKGGPAGQHFERAVTVPTV